MCMYVCLCIYMDNVVKYFGPLDLLKNCRVAMHRYYWTLLEQINLKRMQDQICHWVASKLLMKSRLGLRKFALELSPVLIFLHWLLVMLFLFL